MMKFGNQASLAAILACALGGSCLTARAELDYEYAEELMRANTSSFSTEDLIERLVARLMDKPETQTEAKLIKASYRRGQAKSASVKKRYDNLVEAESLYKDILADKKLRKELITILNRDNESIDKDLMLAAIGMANDSGDQNKAKELRSKAAEKAEKIALEFKTQTEAAQPKFDAQYKVFLDYNKKHEDPETGEAKPPAGRDIMEPLEKAFDEWIIADKKYVNKRVDQLECYDDSDPLKKKLADEMATFCEARVNNEILSGTFPVIAAWYSMMKGRIHAQVSDEDKASEAWNTALSVDMSQLKDDQRKQMFMIKKIIIHDLVELNMKKKKYATVEKCVGEQLVDNKSLFEDDAGKYLLMDYAKALSFKDDAQPEDVAKGIGKMSDSIEKEKGGLQSDWAYKFSRAMAEILEYARTKKGLMPRLGAKEFYYASRGFYALGLSEWKRFDELDHEKKGDPGNKPQYEKAYAEFQNAVDFYRRSITAARNEYTGDLVSRVTIEPKAWFEMGICYLKMKHYYEAVISWEAMRKTFLPEFRSKWVPDPNSKEGKLPANKPVYDALAELDKPRDGLLVKSGIFVTGALDENAKLHKDPYNQHLKTTLVSEDKEILQQSGITDLDYNKAKEPMDKAKEFADTAKGLTGKDAEDSYVAATKKYIEAAEGFQKVKVDSKAYELALFQTAWCYKLDQTLWVTGKIPIHSANDKEKQAEIDKQHEIAKDLGSKGIKALDQYLEFVEKNPAKSEDDKKRREGLEGDVLLAKNTLAFDSEDWEAAIKTADAYMDWERKNPQGTKSKIDSALFNKFFALVKQAKINVPPKCDDYINLAESAMHDLKVLKPKDTKSLAFMREQLDQTLSLAAARADKMLKEGNKDVTQDMLDNYEKKVGVLQSERVQSEDNDTNATASLDDYSRLVYLLDKQSQRLATKDPAESNKLKQQSADLASRLLEKFDPKNLNVRILDEAPIWKALLSQLIGDVQSQTKGLLTIKDFGMDPNRFTQCQTDHTILFDYMYDEVAPETPIERRPPNDKYKSDMEKALAQLKTLKKNYGATKDKAGISTLPDFSGKPTAAALAAVDNWVEAVKGKYPDMASFKTDPKNPETLKAPLTLVEEEIDFRRKIEATRRLLCKQAQALIQWFQANKQDDQAAKYRDMAIKQIDILLKMGESDSPPMMLLSAEMKITNQKYEDALDDLYHIREILKRDGKDQTDDYFTCMRRISEVYAKQNKWKNAAEYPVFIAATTGISDGIAKRLWPDMGTFLEECYKNGVARPKEAVKKEEKKDDSSKDEKKDDTKKEEAKDEKKDEAKDDKNAPAPDKKDEKKDDKKEETK